MASRFRRENEVAEHVRNVEDILALSADEVLSWMATVEVGGEVDGAPFNWHGLAFTAASRAVKQHDLTWGRVAVLIYEELARRAHPADARSFRLSAMRVRAALINRFGDKPGDEVLDFDRIRLWFEQVPSMSVEDATRIIRSADSIVAIPIETLRRLREVKNALNVLHLISRTELWENYPDLDRWLRLRDDLP
jgi:hypothetical protein